MTIATLYLIVRIADYSAPVAVYVSLHSAQRQSKKQNKNANAKLKAWVHIRTQTFGSKPKKEAFVVCARSNTERDAKTLLFTIVSGPKKGGVGAGDQVREIGP